MACYVQKIGENTRCCVHPIPSCSDNIWPSHMNVLIQRRAPPQIEGRKYYRVETTVVQTCQTAFGTPSERELNCILHQKNNLLQNNNSKLARFFFWPGNFRLQVTSAAQSNRQKTQKK